MSLKKAGIFFLLFAIIAGGAVFIWFQGRQTQGLTVELFAPAQVAAGTPFDLEITLTNNSPDVLRDSRLAIELPEGVAFIGNSVQQTLETRSIGLIDPGTVNQQKFTLIVTEGENTVKTIKARASYLPANLKSRFEEASSLDVSVGTAGVDIEASAPQKVFSGEEFETVITYRNVSNVPLKDLRLNLALPSAFTRISSSDQPEKNGTTWTIKELEPNQERKLTLKGTLAGPDEAFFELGVEIEALFGTRRYPIASQAATIAIAPSPITLSIQLDGGEEMVAMPGEDLRYTLNFKNNTDIGLKDVVIRAKLVGSMFDLQTLSSKAFFQQNDRTLVWNASSIPELSLLVPGASGSADFSVRVTKTYPIKALSDKNFTIAVNASIESPTVPYYVSSPKTMSLANVVTKIGGDTIVETRGIFRDAAAGVINTGPWPMKVGQPTQFTVHWVVTNYATDVANVNIKAFLGPNAKFVKVIKSSTSLQPEYNTNTQEISWSIPTIVAAKGVATAPHEAIFQIESIPAVGDIGKSMTLLGPTTLTARDEFTKKNISNQADQLTTSNLSDPTVQVNEVQVQP